MGFAFNHVWISLDKRNCPMQCSKELIFFVVTCAFLHYHVWIISTVQSYVWIPSHFFSIMCGFLRGLSNHVWIPFNFCQSCVDPYDIYWISCVDSLGVSFFSLWHIGRNNKTNCEPLRRAVTPLMGAAPLTRPPRSKLVAMLCVHIYAPCFDGSLEWDE